MQFSARNDTLMRGDLLISSITLALCHGSFMRTTEVNTKFRAFKDALHWGLKYYYVILRRIHVEYDTF